MDVANLDIRADSSSVKTASANLKGMGVASSGAMSKIKLLSGALVAMGAGRVLSKVITDTNQFTKSISELSAITGATGKDLAFYEKEAAKIGKTTTLSASQAATAFKLIASAKPDLLASKEALAAVTKEAVTLAEAAGVGLADAAQTVGVSLNQFGAEADQAARFVNVLAAGAKMGSSSITDTSQAMKNAGVAAKLAGLSFEEANVGVQLLAKGGLFAAEAGTGFKQVLLKLENEAENKFKPSIVGLAGALENLAAEEMSLTELTELFGAEAMKSAAVMIDGAADARTLEAAITGTSIASEMAATNFDNMEGDMLSLNSANEGLAITLGTMLEPIIRKVIQSVTDFSRKVDDFVQSEKFNDVLKAMTIAAQTLAAIMTGQIIGALAKTSTAFVTTSTSAGLASTAVAKLKVALALLGGPIGITVTALVGLYAIMSNVFGFDFEDFKRYFSATFEVISGYVTTFATAVTGKFKEVFQYLATLFQPYIDVYVTAFNKILNIVSSFFTSFTSGASAAINFVITSFSNGFLNIRQYIETTKINIVAFYETMKVKATSLIDSERETAAKLATINENKAISLQAVNDKYADMADAQVTTRQETGFLDTAFDTLNTTSETISGNFADFISEIKNTADEMDTSKTAAENYDSAIESAYASVGVLKTNLGTVHTSLNTLSANFDLRTSAAGSFTVVTGAMEAMAEKTDDVSSDMETLATNTDTAATAIGGTNGQGGLTLAQTTFTTAVENTQTAWATLIKDIVTTGKIDFKSFFDTVKSGFVAMVSEIAAQNITNAIFGSGGLSGFLSSLTGGFNSIISSIASGLGGIVSSFVSSLAGLGGSAAGSAAGGAGIAASIAGAAGTVGKFVSGLTGTATGIAAGTVGPPTAAALAGSGVTGTLAAGGAKAIAVLTNPVTLTVAAIAVAAKLLDKSGTMSANAGMLTQNLGSVGADRKFDIPEFASGAKFTGFMRREDQATAMAVVDSFAALDSALTAAAMSVGITPNLNAGSFNGSNEEGRGLGAFFGSASEDGKNKSASLQSQLDSYASQWVTLVGNQNNVDPSVIADVIGGGTAAGILDRTKPDASLASGINRIPFDGFMAELHEGERVQSVAEVKRADLMASEMNSLRGNLNELMLVVAKAVSKSARIESRWDINGLPPTRT